MSQPKNDPKKASKPQMVEIPPVQINYPAIEKLIENEDFEVLNKNFTKAYEGLENLSKGKGGLSKVKQEAKKVMRALELTMDLLTELLKAKYRLAEEQGGEGRPQGGS